MYTNKKINDTDFGDEEKWCGNWNEQCRGVNLWKMFQRKPRGCVVCMNNSDIKGK